MAASLKNTNPKMHVKCVDSSMTPPKGSVNDSPIRKGVAATPKTLGPRNA